MLLRCTHGLDTYAETSTYQKLCLAQAELALHKREAAARGPSKPRGRAGGDSRLTQSSGVEGSEAGVQTEPEATNDKLATAQREAEELSTSLAKASSFIEVQHSLSSVLN